MECNYRTDDGMRIIGSLVYGNGTITLNSNNSNFNVLLYAK